MKSKKINIKNIFILVFALVVASIGVSLMMKANIGLGAFDAMYASISYLTNIKVGTIVILTNLTVFLIQLFILKRDFEKFQLLQILLVVILGEVINLVYYQIFKFEVDGYLLRLLTFILGIIITSFGLSVLVHVDIISPPVESLAKVISNIKDISFSKVRFLFDIVAVAITLTITFAFDLPFTLREGTIIGMIVFNTSLAFFLKLLGNMRESKTYKKDQNNCEGICSEKA